MTPPLEAERIAKLTKGQRLGLLAMEPHEPNYSTSITGACFASLVRAGLAYKTQHPWGGWRHYRLTNEGENLRDILLKEPKL